MNTTVQNVNRLSNSESLSEFMEYYKSFAERHGDNHLDLDLWFARVQKYHQNIREKIGGIRHSYTIKLSNNDKEIVFTPEEAIYNVWRSIYNLCDSESGNRYSKSMKIVDELIKDGILPKGFESSYIIDSHSRKRKSSKIILDKFNKLKLFELESIVSKFGQFWTKSIIPLECKDLEVDINLTTSAKAFILLGHYGPDSDSCFNSNGDNWDNKFTLGQTEDTFVILISDPQTKKNLARLWGWYSKEIEALHFCNIYRRGSKLMHDGVVFAILCDLYQKIFNKPPIRIFDAIEVKTGIYHNEKSFDISLCSSMPIIKLRNDELILYSNIKDIRDGEMCLGCNRLICSDEIVCIKQGNFCILCLENTFDRCSWCGSYHKKDSLVPQQYISDEKIQKVCEDCRSHHCIKCKKCDSLLRNFKHLRECTFSWNAERRQRMQCPNCKGSYDEIF